MKLIDEVLKNFGGDTMRSVTLIPGFGAYLKSVKGVSEYSAEKIVLAQRKNTVEVSGKNLRLESYFEEDAVILGEVSKVEIC